MFPQVGKFPAQHVENEKPRRQQDPQLYKDFFQFTYRVFYEFPRHPKFTSTTTLTALPFRRFLSKKPISHFKPLRFQSGGFASPSRNGFAVYRLRPAWIEANHTGLEISEALICYLTPRKSCRR